MLIAQDDSACNNAESQINKISITGNIVPSNWYHNLLRPCAKSDTTSIAILSECCAPSILVTTIKLRKN